MSVPSGAAKSPASSLTQSRINVQLKENVSLDQLQNIVAQVVGHTGCPRCGLLGVDLRLSGDPVEFGQIRQIPGVGGISFE